MHACRVPSLPLADSSRLRQLWLTDESKLELTGLHDGLHKARPIGPFTSTAATRVALCVGLKRAAQASEVLHTDLPILCRLWHTLSQRGRQL